VRSIVPHIDATRTPEDRTHRVIASETAAGAVHAFAICPVSVLTSK
jgi:hypothetical protein